MRVNPVKLLAALAARLRGLARDRRGNVLILVGFAILPLTIATGMSIDYARAARLKTKLDAAADAAALSAVTQTMMVQTDATAVQNAKNLFNGQVTGLRGLVYDPTTLSATLTPQPAGVTNIREITVTYTAQSVNAFGGVLGSPTITITGTSTAKSAISPNIDFYLMVDTSPSMLLPATTAGLSTMTAATGGCAFACHQSQTTASDPGHTAQVNGQYLDYYQVARNAGIVLRTDLVLQAVQNLTDTATSTAAQNGATYRMGIADFDYTYRQIWPLAKSSDGFWVDGSLSRVKTHATDPQIVVYCTNNQRVCGVGDNDMSTNFTTAFTGALATMPLSPGSGTNVAGDTPQAILFIITDGMRDENSGGSRLMGPIPTSQCNSIKARNIRIAILYTEYLPEAASDGWSISNVRNPYLNPPDSISPALTACASAGLFYQVTTNDDISAALANLFAKAVQSARLTR